MTLQQIIIKSIQIEEASDLLHGLVLIVASLVLTIEWSCLLLIPFREDDVSAENKWEKERANNPMHALDKE